MAGKNKMPKGESLPVTVKSRSTGKTLPRETGVMKSKNFIFRAAHENYSDKSLKEFAKTPGPLQRGDKAVNTARQKFRGLSDKE